MQNYIKKTKHAEKSAYKINYKLIKMEFHKTDNRLKSLQRYKKFQYTQPVFKNLLHLILIKRNLFPSTDFVNRERQRQQERQGIGYGLGHLDTLKADEMRQNHYRRDEENALSPHR